MKRKTNLRNDKRKQTRFILVRSLWPTSSPQATRLRFSFNLTLPPKINTTCTPLVEHPSPSVYTFSSTKRTPFTFVQLLLQPRSLPCTMAPCTTCLFNQEASRVQITLRIYNAFPIALVQMCMWTRYCIGKVNFRDFTNGNGFWWRLKLEISFQVFRTFGFGKLNENLSNWP